MRRDVRDRSAEHVRPLLIHEAGAAAFALRLFVGGARLLLALDFAAYPSLTHEHLELVDRRARRQREHVEALDPVVARVLECLGHVNARHVAGDLRVDLRGLAKRFGRRAAGHRAEVERARARSAVGAWRRTPAARPPPPAEWRGSRAS